MVIEYENSLAEHIHAARAIDANGIVGKIYRVAAVLLLLDGLQDLYTRGLQEWPIICFVLAPAFWFNLLPIRPLQVIFSFRSQPIYRQRSRLDFTDDGIHINTPSIDSDIAWSLFNKVTETRWVFLLMHGKRAGTLIPKRAFSSDEEISEFKSLLRRHIV